MAAKILDGKKLSAEIRGEIRDQVSEFKARSGVTPTLAAVLVGDDPASQVYVRNKERACRQAGIASQLHRLPIDTSQAQLLELVERLNTDPGVHGILIQLPLPDRIDSKSILESVRPAKDVDAFHPENVGRILQGCPTFLPCTPHGIQQLLHRCRIKVAGKHVVVVGRSDIVGKPMAAMLLQKDCELGPDAVNATVSVGHSRSPDLAGLTRQADILIVAIGKPNFVTAEMVKPGAVVIDVGINRTDDGLVGDVDFPAVSAVAGHITPVPGGVGPLTVAMLLQNTLRAAQAG